MKKLLLFLPFLLSFNIDVKHQSLTLYEFKKKYIETLSSYTNAEFELKRRTSRIIENDSLVDIFATVAKVNFAYNYPDTLTPFMYKVNASGQLYRCSNGLEALSFDTLSRECHLSKIKPNPYINWKEANYNQNIFLPKFITEAKNFMNRLTDSKKWDKIIFTPDTFFNHQPCYRIYVKVIDTDFVSNEIYGPFIEELFINQENFLPVYYMKYTEVMGQRTVIKMAIANLKKSNFTISDFGCDIDVSKLNTGWKVIDDVAHAETISKKEAATKGSKIGKKVPDWAAYTLNDSLITNKTFSNQFYLLDFSYINCFFCIKCISGLNHVSEKYKNLNVFWLDGHDKSTIVIKNFIKKSKIKFNVYYRCLNAEEDFGVYSNPHLFLINPDGIIVEEFSGYNENFESELESIISKYIKE
ncbi:MAG: hypothetical protein RIQ33_1077 [Bacteroidota bacterium]|jgi:hypothetical protein